MAASEFELQVLAELAAIRSVGAATAQQVNSLETRLFNGGSGVIHNIQQDIQEIKDDRQRDEKWDRLHRTIQYSTGPILVALHVISRKLGLDV